MSTRLRSATTRKTNVFEMHLFPLRFAEQKHSCLCSSGRTFKVLTEVFIFPCDFLGTSQTETSATKFASRLGKRSEIIILCLTTRKEKCSVVKYMQREPVVSSNKIIRELARCCGLRCVRSQTAHTRPLKSRFAYIKFKN
jgi:hypothetical protein